MKVNSKRVREFIFEQHCVPWRIRIRFIRWRNILLNVNTVKYWDGIWSKELREGKKRDLDSLYDAILLHISSGLKVLDVGCGLGVLLERIRKERNCEVFGVDISQKAIEYLQERGISGAACRVPPIPFPDSEFDITIATQLLEHVVSPSRVLNEIFRVTKEGGLCIFSVPDNCMFPHEEREHNHFFSADGLRSLTKRVKSCVSCELSSVGTGSKNCKRILAICEKRANCPAKARKNE